ncbi:reticulocyte-binding protein homolog 2a-like [Melitaea cinxia]|uniref:reticulocyte-binding protein homolog 2a-like n=1 Tax=Melitaea cinxia TaxID=113334 RepID=UPI001E272C90|nr:reticulocyte-binding protein homolog 2a-like [Melitaea cinxia]
MIIQIVPDVNYYEEDSYVARKKRSVEDDSNKNHTINFIHTIDDINEDTLKDTNKSGTIAAQKVDIEHLPKVSRRTKVLDNLNQTDSTRLHIEYNSQEYDHHITENKIEIAPETKKLDIMSNSKLYKVMGNYSQSVKNKELSALVVNELKRGTEVIGDQNVPPMSNITFTPENDTLTAMTFIAGNLLNKLWDMEKESSDESIETLKHKKINDLLELFKEPLSVRQETFLKNALLKLSDTLNKNKNVKNVSICETITDSDILSDGNINENEFKTDKKNKTNCAKHNLEKKQNNPTKQTQSHKPNVGDPLTVDENSPINLFGNLLERITELLLPNNASKKFTNKLKTLNQFSSTDDAKKNIEDKFKINLDKNNMTVKDKIIFDYLNHIENNPNCLLKQQHKKIEERKINVEGDILYNLSEFFKIKSMIDLVKLTKPETTTTMDTITTTESNKKQTTPRSILRDTASNMKPVNETQKLNITKEKLKNHLKALIDDLLELQNEKDPKSKNNIKILEALPCIYNILNADSLNTDWKPKKQDTEPLKKIKALIDSLKLEFTSNVPTRRNNLIATERPRSARIWERMLKNVNNLRKENRRNPINGNPKSYEELKTIMEVVETSSNTYKNFALLSVIPAQKRLMLLKTLEADTKQKILVLQKIKDSLDNLNKLPSDKVKNIEKTKQVYYEKSEVEVFDPKKLEVKKQMLNIPETSPDIPTNYKNKDFKLTRDQILGRLIENRIQLYLTSKEQNNGNLSGDIGYNIGKRILTLLRQGNFNVAKELFKVFIANKQQEMEKKNESVSLTANVKEKRPLLLALKEPLIRLDESSKKTPEQLFRQLLNLKNMNIK